MNSLLFITLLSLALNQNLSSPLAKRTYKSIQAPALDLTQTPKANVEASTPASQQQASYQQTDLPEVQSLPLSEEVEGPVAAGEKQINSEQAPLPELQNQNVSEEAESPASIENQPSAYENAPLTNNKDQPLPEEVEAPIPASFPESESACEESLLPLAQNQSMLEESPAPASELNHELKGPVLKNQPQSASEEVPAPVPEQQNSYEPNPSPETQSQPMSEEVKASTPFAEEQIPCDQPQAPEAESQPAPDEVEVPAPVAEQQNSYEPNPLPETQPQFIAEEAQAPAAVSEEQTPCDQPQSPENQSQPTPEEVEAPVPEQQAPCDQSQILEIRPQAIPQQQNLNEDIPSSVELAQLPLEQSESSKSQYLPEKQNLDEQDRLAQPIEEQTEDATPLTQDQGLYQTLSEPQPEVTEESDNKNTSNYSKNEVNGPLEIPIEPFSDASKQLPETEYNATNEEGNAKPESDNGDYQFASKETPEIKSEENTSNIIQPHPIKSSKLI